MQVSPSRNNWYILGAAAIRENRLMFWAMWDSHASTQHLGALLRNQKNQREFTCVFALRFFLSGLPSCTPGPPNPSNPLSPPTKFQTVQYCVSFLTERILNLPLSVTARDICDKYWACFNSSPWHCTSLRRWKLAYLKHSYLTLLPLPCPTHGRYSWNKHLRLFYLYLSLHS